jgi:hypothetical protein
VRICADIRDVQWPLSTRSLSDNPIARRHRKIRLKTADLGTERKLIRVGIDQQYRRAVYAKIIPHNGENLPQDLIEIKS